MRSGCFTISNVFPGCPGWPPDFFPERFLWLRVFFGFLNPSDDGGLPLFLLFFAI